VSCGTLPSSHRPRLCVEHQTTLPSELVAVVMLSSRASNYTAPLHGRPSRLSGWEANFLLDSSVYGPAYLTSVVTVLRPYSVIA
jgi:hypothetical protein